MVVLTEVSGLFGWVCAWRLVLLSKLDIFGRHHTAENDLLALLEQVHLKSKSNVSILRGEQKRDLFWQEDA